MPVVTVLTRPHPALPELLAGVANSVQAALTLAPGDVIAVHQPAGASVASGTSDLGVQSAWMLISIHGSDRGDAASAAARTAAADAATVWGEQHDAGCEGVWCEWVTP